MRWLLSDEPHGWLAELRKQFDLSPWRFALSVESLALDGEAQDFEVDEDGYGTALGQALDHAYRKGVSHGSLS